MTMREILFRGKCVRYGDWIFGWYSKACYGSWPLRDAIADADKADAGCLGFEEVDPKTVGQFTGLTDKNGKKIFEGDIVQAKEPDTSYRFGCVWPLQVVVFREGSYGLLEFNKFFKSFRSFALSVTFEIVGNIHDNPELMEDE